jgi:hypothetical protein
LTIKEELEREWYTETIERAERDAATLSNAYAEAAAMDTVLNRYILWYY